MKPGLGFLGAPRFESRTTSPNHHYLTPRNAMLFAWLAALIWLGFSNAAKIVTTMSWWMTGFAVTFSPQGAFGQSDFGSQESRDP